MIKRNQSHLPLIEQFYLCGQTILEDFLGPF